MPDAFSGWTSIPTAAVTATRAGQLAEDVSGANVILNADRTITMPIDIQPSAAATPVAVIYDADGAVTDALIGSGASADCFTNAAFGGLDAFTTDGHFAHALVILDGKCAKTAARLPDLKYWLVRVLGQVFGPRFGNADLPITVFAMPRILPTIAITSTGTPSSSIWWRSPRTIVFVRRSRDSGWIRGPQRLKPRLLQRWFGRSKLVPFPEVGPFWANIRWQGKGTTSVVPY